MSLTCNLTREIWKKILHVLKNIKLILDNINKDIVYSVQLTNPKEKKLLINSVYFYSKFFLY